MTTTDDRSGAAGGLASIRDALVGPILRVIPAAQAIYAYGSRVSGHVHAESDLDLALLVARNTVVPLPMLLQLRGDLEALAGCPVDVTVLDLTGDVVLCKEVVSQGALLYAADRRAVAVFEMRALGDYARLCEERIPVVRSYLAEESRGG